MRSIFEGIILDHYRRPRHRGELEGEHTIVYRDIPTCGDEITLHLDVEGGCIARAAFQGHGCSISQASASMMLERVAGKELAEARVVIARFRQMLRGDEEAARDPLLGDLRALAGVAVHPARVRCAMLAWTALEEGMA